MIYSCSYFWPTHNTRYREEKLPVCTERMVTGRMTAPQTECGHTGMEPGAMAAIRPRMNYSGIYSSKRVHCKQTNTSFIELCVWENNWEFEIVWGPMNEKIGVLSPMCMWVYMACVLWFLCVCVCMRSKCMPQYTCSFDEQGWLKTLCYVSPNTEHCSYMPVSVVPGWSN